MAERIPHPNDLMEFAQYADSTYRETYPPLPRRTGNHNMVDTHGVVLGLSGPIGKKLPAAVTRELTKAQEASMIPSELAATDEVAQLQAAGWL